MEKRLFSVSCTANKLKETPTGQEGMWLFTYVERLVVHRLSTVEAVSKEEAEGIGLSRAKEECKPENGWHDFDVIAAEIPQKLIDNYASKRQTHSHDIPDTSYGF